MPKPLSDYYLALGCLFNLKGLNIFCFCNYIKSFSFTPLNEDIKLTSNNDKSSEKNKISPIQQHLRAFAKHLARPGWCG